jgi:hypothetical protein
MLVSAEGAAGAALGVAGAGWFPFTARAIVAARRPTVETLSTPTAALRVPVLSFWEGGHMAIDKEEERGGDQQRFDRYEKL